MYEIKNLSFSYRIGTREVSVLSQLNLKVNRGEFVGIQGPSGSGKSTLFYILGFLLKPSSGHVLLDGQDITALDEESLTLIRSQKIGFVFQQFHLLPRATTLQNILLPTRYPSEIAVPSPEHQTKAQALATQLGLAAHLTHLPNQLSGGQQQRVAIARALMKDIDLILADEPTGNLDSQNAEQILDLLNELNRQGKTIILITHDAEVAKRCSKVYHLKDGAFTRVVENSAPPVAKPPPSQSPSTRFAPLIDPVSKWVRVLRAVAPLATGNLLRNKAKSALTMLGVIIGVAAVLAMITVGQFTKRRILETYETLGVNKLKIRGHRNWRLKATDQVMTQFSGFRWESDFERLKSIFPEVTLLSPLMTGWNYKVMAGGLVLEDKIGTFGILPELLAITDRHLIAGRNLSPFHVQMRSPVCVVGFQIANRLFPRNNPIGQMLTLTDGRNITFPCRIIGVLAQLNSPRDWLPPDQHIFLPYTYYQTAAESWNNQITEAVMQVSNTADIELTGKKIQAYFSRKYGKAGEFNIDSDSALIAQMKRFLNLFTAMLAGIAALALAVGGIGIHNMMLVSVSERIREFGLRKALGATHFSVEIQVLLESLVLCVVAGILGVGLGFAAYELLIFGLTKFVPNIKFEWVVEPIALLLSTLSILAVGLLSGTVPAKRAQKLQVIEALRSE